MSRYAQRSPQQRDEARANHLAHPTPNTQHPIPNTQNLTPNPYSLIPQQAPEVLDLESHLPGSPWRRFVAVIIWLAIALVIAALLFVSTNPGVK